MAAVDPPAITYRSALPASVIQDGRLSDIQYESVLYAGQRHEQKLPDGCRAGYFVGDGTGVGKGRVIAGILLDNWHQGRQRAVWLSVSNDLMESAIRDLDDVAGQGTLPIVRVNEYSPAEAITLERGVVFLTYSSLIAGARGGGSTRREQLERWIGPQGGLVVYDESHKAKNALAEGRGEPTKTGLAVIDLQKNLPDARVVYVSATGATDVRNMAYLTRLGLWGEKTAFPGGFQEFLTEIDRGGVGAMEMVARDLKALGMYSSRSISFAGVEYREVVHNLTPEQRQMYDVAARAWQVVLQNIHVALEVTGADGNARRYALQRFWGDQQRFFRQLITALKVPAAIQETERSLQQGKSVVIGLIGTGEGVTERKVSRSLAEGEGLEDLDFSPREIVARLVEHAFPTQMYQEVTDEHTGKTLRVAVEDENGRPVQSREALAMKAELLEQLSDLRLPENPLDQVVHHFTPEAVAELTGRKRRLLRDPQSGRMEYVKRAPEGVAMTRVNVYEMEQFQGGKKRVAIISDAASTGISLHASNREENCQRRVHITLELGWSADKQMQTFGRTHRSDQASAPEYVLLSTDVGGEKRFSSTIARRLASLGALTKGQRDATGGGDLAKHNFETPEGAAALSALYGRLVAGGTVPGLPDAPGALQDMGLIRADGGIAEDDLRNVPRFLNRVLALDIARQNAMFEAFLATFDEVVQFARESGTFDRGVDDLKALSIRLPQEPQEIHQDETTGASTYHYELEVDRRTYPITWDRMEGVRAFPHSGGAYYRQNRSGRVVYAEPGANRTVASTGIVERTVVTSTPRRMRDDVYEVAEFGEKFTRIEPAEARTAWEEALHKIPEVETEHVHIIGGAILPLWQRLQSAETQQLKVVRATTDSGRRVVGITIPQAQLDRTLMAIGVKRSLKSPAEAFRAVWKEGARLQLVAGLEVRAVKVHGEERIEVTGTGMNSHKFGEMRTMGLFEERIEWRNRFFVPIDEVEGVRVLQNLLERYPATEMAETAVKPKVEPLLSRLSPLGGREDRGPSRV